MTFDPKSTLVVPLNVEAMILGAGDVNVTNMFGPSSDFSLLTADEYFPSRVLDFPSNRVASDQFGVHIHWALPPPLSVGAVSGGGQPHFPPAPDRWLVIRWSDDKALRAAFLVESDHVSETEANGGAAFPVQGVGCRFLGRATAVSSWVATEPEAQRFSVNQRKLTAVGWGEPSFAAYYPNCREVFGFHDRLSGVPAGALSYFVVGWHAVAGDDPLRSVPSPPSMKDLAALGWRTENPAVAKRSVFSGSVSGLAWDPAGRFGPTQISLRQAVGNSMAEAVAALASDPAKAGSEKEALAVLLGDDPRAENGGDVIAAAEKLHAQRYVPRDGGQIWAVTPVATHVPSAEEAERLQLDEEVAAELAGLNAAQRELERLTRRAERLHARIRDGVALLEAMIWDPKAVSPIPELRAEQRVALRRRLARDVAAHEAIDPGAAEQRRAARRISLGRVLLERFPRFELTTRPGPRFWEPRDPVVAVDGVGLKSGPRYPRVAVSKEGVKSLLLDCGPISDGEAMDAAAKGAVADLQITRLPEVAALTERLLDEYIRKVDAPRRTDWARQQFRPLFVKWTVSYKPDAEAPYPSDFLKTDWTPPVAGACEATPTKERGARNTLAQQLTGVSLVDADQAAVMIEALGDRIPPSRGVKSGQTVGYSLSHFHSRLLMLAPGLHLPVKDLRRLLHLDGIPERFLARQNSPLRPNPTQRLFAPLRSGRLTLESVTAIDIFGRAMDWPVAGLIKSFALQSGPSGAAEISLPPRIAAPARLSFRFDSGGDREADGGHAHSSALYGFIVPSPTEQSMLLGDRHGTVLGVLRVENNAVRFHQAPGSPSELPPMLCALAKRFADAPAADFIAMLDAINGEIGGARYGDSGCDPASRLLGRPLALVGAALSLQLYGDTAPRPQRLTNISDDDDGGLSLVETPVELGAKDRAFDGLAGYFDADENGGTDFKTFHSVGGGQNRITVSIASPKRRLVMLVDPATPVHASTGVLPAKAVTLPAAHYRAALPKLEPMFLVGPLLTPRGAPDALPVAQHGGGAVWHWAQAPEYAGGGVTWRTATALPAGFVGAEDVHPLVWLSVTPAAKNNGAGSSS